MGKLHVKKLIACQSTRHRQTKAMDVFIVFSLSRFDTHLNENMISIVRYVSYNA